MTLSKQALATIVMMFQKAILEQEDISDLMRQLDFVETDEGLVVTNPPLLEIDEEKIRKLYEE